MSHILVTRASPITTIQDQGRPGLLSHGIGASGPMDRRAYAGAAEMAGCTCGAAIEIGPQGMDFTYSGAPMSAGLAGGEFSLALDGQQAPWPAQIDLTDGMAVSIRTGPRGNYAYLRFGAQIDVAPVLGSRATNATVGLGGLEGRGLRGGDRIGLLPLADVGPEKPERSNGAENDAIRFIWGIHADQFSLEVRAEFIGAGFRILPRMDRMGVWLDDGNGVFAETRSLGLVSNAVVAGDIQILGNGSPIVLMRDHQPTGGYPRIGTVIDVDLDRFAQMRPGKTVRFTPVTVEHAHRLAGWRP